MNLQSLVVVVLRLMALDFLLRVAVVLIEFRPFQRSPLDSGASVLPWLVLTSLVAGAAFLWFFALPIARLVTRGVSNDLSFGALSLVDCYSIAFMSIGLFYICNNFPQVLNWAHYLFKTAASDPGSSWKENVKWYDVSRAVVPFIGGVILFVNGRRWAVMLARKQPGAPPMVTDVPESDR